MTRKFVYTEPFRRSWKAMGLSEAQLPALEELLLADPQAGDVIEGTGGARKLRIRLEGRGKSGGGRVIYVDIFEKEHLYLLFAYPKNMQEPQFRAEKGYRPNDRGHKKGVSTMAEPKFTTSLSIEEIDENFKDIDFFSGIMDGSEEALAYSKGKAAANTFARKRSLPSINVAELRSSLNVTQKVFADILGVSCRTVEAWESGKSTPTPTAKKLMYLIREDNSLIEKLSV